MCGRFTLMAPEELLAEAFGVDDVPPLPPRYNIAPTQPVAVVRQETLGAARRLDLVRWGVSRTPAARPPSRSEGCATPGEEGAPAKPRRGPLINVRSEGLGRSKSFRDAFAHRRCLVPADGFYEWTGARRPYYLHRRDGRPFAFAGLWEPGDDGGCVILTTAPNGVVRKVHDRMPVILDPRDYGVWLAGGDGAQEPLRAVCRPCPDDVLDAYPVGAEVNDWRLDTSACLRRAPGLFD